MAKREGRKRVVIEGMTPEIDAGRFPVKRVCGEEVVVEVDAFSDGHDLLRCILRYRPEGATTWHEAPMEPLGNDRWRGAFRVSEMGIYRYTVTAWIDRFASWRRDLVKKVEADQDVAIDLLIGAELVERASKQASGSAAEQLRAWASSFREEHLGAAERGR